MIFTVTSQCRSRARIVAKETIGNPFRDGFLYDGAADQPWKSEERVKAVNHVGGFESERRRIAVTKFEQLDDLAWVNRGEYAPLDINQQFRHAFMDARLFLFVQCDLQRAPAYGHNVDHDTIRSHFGEPNLRVEFEQAGFCCGGLGMLPLTQLRFLFVRSLRRQMDDMYETVALGLTAEALSHEIFQIADNLAQRVKAAESRLKGQRETDRTITTLIETVRSSVMALPKQISYLSPALKYVREQRHEFSIPVFLEELEAHYHERLERSNIRLVVPECADQEAFLVRMNKGKMAQILDNLILNSEYWLKADIKAGRIREGRITMEARRPFLRISDNGRGIDPSIEAALFEPFVSAKGRGLGRGLGLFIVKQLLDSEACTIGVIPERNRSGRLFKFQIDLRGAFNA